MTNYLLQLVIETIAEACHNVNKAYCESIGDFSQPEWEDAPEWQRKSACNGVRFHLSSTEDLTPEDSHNNWLAEKLADGWKYGPVKDPDKKEHPCIMPYKELPVEQQVKDKLFMAVVSYFKKAQQE